jgi:phi13 family phage major tail protein
MSEKVTFGIKNVYYAPKTVSEGGVVSYGTPVRLPGASEISLPTVGDPVKVYADNVVYVKFNVNQGYEGNLSIYNIPESFSKDILGMTTDGNGVLVENASAVQKDFALMFEFDTDTAKTKRSVLYNVSAGRPDQNGKTKEESIDPEAYSIPIAATPLEGTEWVKASIVGDSTNTTWANWFSSVYTPDEDDQYQVEVLVSTGSAGIKDALVVCGGKIGMTNASGKAYFMLPAGTYDILVSASGYVADVDTVTVVDANVEKTITMVGA